MKELNKKLSEEILEYYKSYKDFMDVKKELSDHNRDMKNDFMETHFDKDEVEVEDIKRIKKEITKYFNTIDEVDSGSDPVSEVKYLRKNHLDFKDDMYEDLMKIFKQIGKNNIAKKELDDRLEERVFLKLVILMGSPIDVIKGIFKLSSDIEAGKFPVLLNVVDDYRKLIPWFDK